MTFARRGFPHHRFTGTMLACACVMLACPATTRAQTPQTPPTPQAGVLVLRGGEVVQGEVSRVGDSYNVAFDDDGRMRLPQSAVDVYAVDMLDAYRQLLAKTDGNDAQRQLALAQWCLRQNLLAQAADRLLAATLIDPRHPGIASVEARLWQATQPSAETAPAMPAASPESSQAAVARTWDSVPPAAVESFTSGVQPLLINRCAGCHRPGTGLSFQLLRPPSGHPTPRRFTERNLAAVLAICDRGSAEESPLLVVPRGAHGGVKPIIASAEAAQWEKVVRWIETLTEPQGIQLAAEVQPHEAVLWQPSGESASTANGSERAAKPDQNWPPAREPSPQRGESGNPAAEVEVPRDPFDPEIFNRRYFNDAPKEPWQPVEKRGLAPGPMRNLREVETSEGACPPFSTGC